MSGLLKQAATLLAGRPGSCIRLTEQLLPLADEQHLLALELGLLKRGLDTLEPAEALLRDLEDYRLGRLLALLKQHVGLAVDDLPRNQKQCSLGHGVRAHGPGLLEDDEAPVAQRVRDVSQDRQLVVAQHVRGYDEVELLADGTRVGVLGQDLELEAVGERGVTVWRGAHQLQVDLRCKATRLPIQPHRRPPPHFHSIKQLTLSIGSLHNTSKTIGARRASELLSPVSSTALNLMPPRFSLRICRSTVRACSLDLVGSSTSTCEFL
jgi:hypothetical protein